MALISCPECDNEISDKAPSCPHCGYVAKPERPKVKDKCPKCGKSNWSEPQAASRYKPGCGCLGVILFGIVGGAVGGPAGLLLGAAIGAIGGFDIGRQRFMRICLNCGKQIQI